MFFTIEKFERRIEELKQRRYFGHQTITPFTAMPGELNTDEVYHEIPDRIAGDEFQLNDFFVGRDRYLWLEKEVVLPPEKKGCKVAGLFDFGKSGEGLNSSFESLLYLDREPYQGVDTYHNEVVFTGLAGKTVNLIFLLWTGLEGGGPVQSFYHRLKQADLVYLHAAADEFYYYADAITRTLRLLPEESTKRTDLMTALDRAFYEIDWDEEAFYATVEAALRCLKEELQSLDAGSDVTVHAIGHTHIDVAWLWRLKHTREKAQRSFSTVLHLMEEYGDYVFLQSQPQLYQYIKQDAPALYARIKEKINEGKWEPEGGMWVEADCNIVSGESLVRQLLHGINFMEEEFGKRCEYLWLPDVFGYSWALPQILKQCGIKTFMTSKISWNQYNAIPNDVFRWRGMDGSEILTYFISTPPEGQDMTTGVTYNGLLTPYSVLGSWKKFKNKELSKEVLISYGYGDGGGGVTRDMLELRRKMDEIPGLPNVKTTTAGSFFRQLHESVDHTDRYVPVWNGELYLEYHRGTYTSQAYNKKMNRYFENQLALLEGLSSMADLLGYGYDRKTLHDSWECVLLHQFHDIIPGSAIHEVYEDCRVNYQAALQSMEKLKETVINFVSERKENHYTLFSICSFGGREQIYIATEEEGGFYSESGWLPSQRSVGGYYVQVETRPYQMINIRFQPEKDRTEESHFLVQLDKNRIETPYYEIEWLADGRLSRIYDREQERSVLGENEYGNVLEVYEDKPMKFDAWDIDLFYQQKKETAVLAEPVELVEKGNLRAVLRFTYRYRQSRITQDMILYSDTGRIDFVSHVDWRETNRLLKAAFYTDIHVTKAVYDIQFGHVERPTHWNTSWDWAKFEVCAHKWADLSEKGYGVSLLNDSKYGYSIKDNALKLSLLKSAKYPDYTADMGIHEFTYSLFPHRGDCIEGGTIGEANRLNVPAAVFKNTVCPNKRQLVSVSTDAVQIDAVKKAEKEDCLIVRMHECHGSTARFTVRSEYGVKKIARCNLIEQDTGISYNGSWTELILKPFEICTLKLYFKNLDE